MDQGRLEMDQVLLEIDQGCVEMAHKNWILRGHHIKTVW